MNIFDKFLKIKSNNNTGINLVSDVPKEYSYIKPVIDYFQSKEIPISFYLGKSLINSDLIKLTKKDFLFELDALSLRFRFRKVIYRIFRRITWFFLKPFIKVPYINLIISKLMSLFFNNPLKYKTTLTITKHRYPWLLCSRNSYIITFPGSWDHYIKFFLGYYSDIYFGWSHKMNSHWREYQGCRYINLGYPYIFDYLSDINLPRISENNIKRQNQEQKRLKILYPLTTCLVYGEIIYNAELNLVKIIEQALLNLDVDFLVKARPNSTKSEIDELSRMFRLPPIAEPIKKSINSFSKEYNFQRRQLLETIDSVINFGTTFVVDSAIAQLPIMQLDMRLYKHKEILDLSSLQNKFGPLEDYLLDQKDLIYSIRDDDDIYKSVMDYYKDISNVNLNSKPYKFSKYLRESFTGTNYLHSKFRQNRLDGIFNCINSYLD